MIDTDTSAREILHHEHSERRLSQGNAHDITPCAPTSPRQTVSRIDRGAFSVLSLAVSAACCCVPV